MNYKILLTLALLSLVSCGERDDNKVYIAATTDVHGVIFGKDPSTRKESRTSMSKISGFLKQFERDNLLLLDNGDNLQGTPTVYYYNFEDVSIPHLWPRVVNYMGYEAITVGNHDIEAGHNVYDRIRPQFDAPLLAANAIDTSTGDPYFTPYTIIRKNGLRIAVFGLITPGIPGWLPEVLYQGIEFQDMVESAEKWMPEIKSKNPDLIVGLFHAGWNENYGGGEPGSLLNENASLSVARNVEGFDIVIIGHDHDIMNNYLVNVAGDSVLILDGGSHSRYLSVAEVTVNGANSTKGVTVTGRHIKVDSLVVDQDFDLFFENDFNLVSSYINRPIGKLARTITSRESYFGDSGYMDLIHVIQLQTSGADVSFAAPLSFDVKIDSGELKVSDMFDLYRYENMLYTIELTGDEIDAYLEYSSSLWFNTLEPGINSVLKFQDKDSNQLVNRYYNFDSAAGIDYTIDLSREDGNRVTISGFSDKRTFSGDSTYTVAVNSYRGSGGGGHLTRGCKIPPNELKKRLINSTEKDLRYYMMKWIEDKQEIDILVDNNWSIAPVELTDLLSKKDYDRLF